MRKIIFALAFLLYAGAYAQTTNIYVNEPVLLVPKKGTHVGITGSWDNTGILIGNFDIYPNNKVFLGVSFGSRDIINTRELLWTEQLVAGRLGLRILPWTYIVGSAGNHRYEPPVYETAAALSLVESLPYKDEFFWSGGVQINIPWLLFNKFRITGGVSYSNRNTHVFDKADFNFNTLEAAGETFRNLLESDLTWTVGVRIPLK